MATTTSWQPTQKLLKKLFYYNPKTGLLFHKIAKRGTKVGAVVGSVRKTGSKYRITKITNPRTHKAHAFYVHRLIWIWNNGDIPKGLTVDHIAEQTSYPVSDEVFNSKDDNRICNLQVISREEQQRKRGYLRKSDIKHAGVAMVKRTKKTDAYTARLLCNGEHIFIGTFDTVVEAILAREEAEEAFYGKVYNKAAGSDELCRTDRFYDLSEYPELEEARLERWMTEGVKFVLTEREAA